MGTRMARWKARVTQFIVDFPRKHKKKKIALEAVIVGVSIPILAFANFKFEAPPPLQVRLSAYLSANPWALVALLSWPIVGNVLTSILGDWIRNRAETGTPASEELQALVTAMDEVEGKKLNRFAEFARQVEREPAIASKAFLSITRPDKQIETLIQNLHHTLTLAMKDETLKIVLATIANDEPKAWRCQMPNDVLLPDRLLGVDAGKTMFAHAAQKRTTMIIEDIELHLSRGKRQRHCPFAALGNASDDKGSIACKPLYSPQLGRVLYVLSIKSDRHKSVRKNFEKRHQLVLKAFCNRLLLEAHLEVIRQHAGGSDDSR